MFSNSCLNLAKVGGHLILKSRVGNFRIFLYNGSNTIDAPRDLMKDLKSVLSEVKKPLPEGVYFNLLTVCLMSCNKFMLLACN